MNYKGAIFVTARLGSTRLPKKHLKYVCSGKCNGKERYKERSIEFVFEQIKYYEASRGIKVILCTTDLKEDDELCAIVDNELRAIVDNGFYGAHIFRGSAEDKLQRWLDAAKTYDVDFFVTFDADDLFCSLELIDNALLQYGRDKSIDFIYGPKDLICGAFTYGIKTSALEKVCQIKNTADTEMIEKYFMETGMFNTCELKHIPATFRKPWIRATLDYKEDLKFFRNVICYFRDRGKMYFTLDEVILYLLEHPEVVKINQFRHKEWKENQERKTKLVLK